MDARKLAQAQRCQLCIGSFDGNIYGCPCDSPKDCSLTETERAEARKLPAVQQAREKATKLWESLSAPTTK